MNGWLFINKPLGLTSVQTLGKARRIIQGEKAGHAGTLDPLASGVLPLAFGEALKLISVISDCDKEYEFRVDWGKETDTGDKEGKITETSDVIPSKEEIEKIIPLFVGNIKQTPPKYSAIKIDGKRAYDLAREDKEFEMTEREIVIYDLVLIENDEKSAKFSVKCSKGTYVRSLAVDIARALGTRGFVSELTRTRVGNIALKDCISLEDLEKNPCLHPINDSLLDISEFNITQNEAIQLRLGIPILIRKYHNTDSKTMLALYNKNPVALITNENGYWKVIRGINLLH